MRHHAYIIGSKVVKVEEISASQWLDDIKNYDYILDVEETFPRPSMNWDLGSDFTFSMPGNITDEGILLIQQNSQRIFGMKLSSELIDLMGARNLFLDSLSQSVDISALLNSLGVAKSLLETGALKTARGYISAVRPGYTAHDDLLGYAIDKITEFLTQMGYE